MKKRVTDILGYISLGFLQWFLIFMFIFFFNNNERVVGIIGIFIIAIMLFLYYKKKQIIYKGIFFLISVSIIVVYCIALYYSYKSIKNLEINNLVKQIEYIEYSDSRQ